MQHYRLNAEGKVVPCGPGMEWSAHLQELTDQKRNPVFRTLLCWVDRKHTTPRRGGEHTTAEPEALKRPSIEVVTVFVGLEPTIFVTAVYQLDGQGKERRIRELTAHKAGPSLRSAYRDHKRTVKKFTEQGTYMVFTKGPAKPRTPEEKKARESR